MVEEAYILQNTQYAAEELYHISFKDPLPFVPMEERLIQELDTIMAKMPPKCKQAFRLKWLEGKKIREIAIIMDISTTMVDKHLAKGLKIARENLDPGLFILLLAGIKTD